MNTTSDGASYEKIGKMLKERREALNLSQQEVADYVQVSKSAVSRWESGELENMGRSKIQALAKILEISPISIIFGEEYQENILPLKTKKVPLLGTIAAGEPIYTYEDCQAYLEVDEHLGIDFCLKIKGDSMIDARINDGDIVFTRKQSVVENGEIAAVLLDNEATLKRFYKNNGGVILKPENSNYQPRYYTAEDFAEIKILGKAIFFQSML